MPFATHRDRAPQAGESEYRAPGCFLHLFEYACGRRIRRIPKKPTRETPDTASLSNSNRFPLRSAAILVKPVILPPGRAREATKSTGSATHVKTIGIVLSHVLGSTRRWRIYRKDDVHFQTDKLGGDFAQPVRLRLSESYSSAMSSLQCSRDP